jgi:glyoxylase-like metal-dependent hydrolase (beta-lactamase superfamily II)
MSKPVRNVFISFFITGLAFLAMTARAENGDREEGQPIVRMTRLTDRVWVCQLQYGGQKPQGFFPVIVSRDGLIIVDTPMFPPEARAMKAAIIGELGPRDFLYLINTHHHWDHTMGNQHFREATIVGHAFTPVDMKTFTGANFGRFMAQRKEASQKGLIKASLASLEELEKEFQAAPPSRTFEAEDSIRLSDLALILYHTGRDGAPVSLYNHTRSDIFVYIPEEKVLCVGDSHYEKDWLDGPPAYPPADLLNGFLVKCREQKYVIEHIVFGHDPSISKSRERSSSTGGAGPVGRGDRGRDRVQLRGERTTRHEIAERINVDPVRLFPSGVRCLLSGEAPNGRSIVF